MKKKYRKNLIALSSIILILVLGFLIYEYSDSEENEVCFEGNCFIVEIAKTQKEMETGLMFRKLEERRGMLFVYDKEGVYSFWMKNAIISLDMIWINANNQVVYIEHNAQPCEEDVCPPINPGNYAQYVLEVNGGQAKEIGLKVGDKAKIELVD